MYVNITLLDYHEDTSKSSPDQKLTTASEKALHNFSSMTNCCQLDSYSGKISIYKHWTGFTIKKQVMDHWHFFTGCPYCHEKEKKNMTDTKVFCYE